MSLKTALVRILVWSIIFNVIYISSHLVMISGQEISWYWVETARNDLEWTEGLMNRSKLAADRGMLFLFPSDEIRTFWMKSTLIPLDILFLDQNKKVISIVNHANPCLDPTGTTCERYVSTLPAKYVLELKADQSIERQILVGSQAYWILN
jgi:uncharacterized membrane protein (UPF0127 family)